MINKIKDKINDIFNQAEENMGDDQKIILLDPTALSQELQAESEMRIVGLFGDVAEEKIAELIQAVLYLDQVNHSIEEGQESLPIDFYLSTYGGSADDMFALYDVMRIVRETSQINTIGLGKVMSAGVLLLAAGTKGNRKIGKNCRVMIHSVMGGNHGSLHNMMNELEAIEQLQDMYCDALISETKLTRSRLKKMIERKVNVYLSAEEAVELGIADIII